MFATDLLPCGLRRKGRAHVSARCGSIAPMAAHIARHWKGSAALRKEGKLTP